MKDLQKKIAYLQGQVNGMKLDKSPEGQVIGDVLEAVPVPTEEWGVA